jgi:hypothetical protein
MSSYIPAELFPFEIATFGEETVGYLLEEEVNVARAV